jgi:hypothetical protein
MIYIATFDGHKSTFEAVGSTEDEALALLTKYVKESSPRVSQRERFEFFDDDVYVRQVRVGAVYVDNGEVTQ